MGSEYKANQQLVSCAGAQRCMTSIDYLEPGSFMTMCTFKLFIVASFPGPPCARVFRRHAQARGEEPGNKASL